MDSSPVLAAAAARRVEHTVAAGEPVSVAAVAAHLGVTPRHLRRIFADRYRMPPPHLRRDAGAARGDGAPRLRLAWRPPYDVGGVLALLAREQVPGLEQVDGTTWRRTFAVAHCDDVLAGWLACRFAEARCEAEPTVAPALAPTLEALRALPGLGEPAVQTIAMRALGWPDAWPIGDAALPAALGGRDRRRASAIAERWRPWRAYAATRLQLLETPR